MTETTPILNLASESKINALNIKKTYGKKVVLNNVSLDISQNEIVGFLGPNGSGKTTLFYIVAGLVKPTQGAVLLNNVRLNQLPMHRRAQMGITYLPQDSSIFRGLTTEQNIAAILELFEPSKVVRQHKLDQILEEFKLTHVRKQNALSLSGGERRRVEIARSVATNPKFILLDEPFAGVDPIAVADLKSIINNLKKQGVGILITDHNVKDTLEIVDKAYILYNGTILVQGTKEEIISNAQVQQVYLGNSFNDSEQHAARSHKRS